MFFVSQHRVRRYMRRMMRVRMSQAAGTDPMIPSDSRYSSLSGRNRSSSSRWKVMLTCGTCAVMLARAKVRPGQTNVILSHSVSNQLGRNTSVVLPAVLTCWTDLVQQDRPHAGLVLRLREALTVRHLPRHLRQSLLLHSVTTHCSGSQLSSRSLKSSFQPSSHFLF